MNSLDPLTFSYISESSSASTGAGLTAPAPSLSENYCGIAISIIEWICTLSDDSNIVHYETDKSYEQIMKFITKLIPNGINFIDVSKNQQLIGQAPLISCGVFSVSDALQRYTNVPYLCCFLAIGTTQVTKSISGSSSVIISANTPPEFFHPANTKVYKMPFQTFNGIIVCSFFVRNTSQRSSDWDFNGLMQRVISYRTDTNTFQFGLVKKPIDYKIASMTLATFFERTKLFPKPNPAVVTTGFLKFFADAKN